MASPQKHERDTAYPDVSAPRRLRFQADSSCVPGREQCYPTDARSLTAKGPRRGLKMRYLQIAACTWLLCMPVLLLPEAGAATCGDGLVQGGEECDPGGGLFRLGNPTSDTCDGGGGDGVPGSSASSSSRAASSTASTPTPGPASTATRARSRTSATWLGSATREHRQRPAPPAVTRPLPSATWPTPATAPEAASPTCSPSGPPAAARRPRVNATPMISATAPEPASPRPSRRALRLPRSAPTATPARPISATGRAAASTLARRQGRPAAAPRSRSATWRTRATGREPVCPTTGRTASPATTGSPAPPPTAARAARARIWRSLRRQSRLSELLQRARRIVHRSGWHEL